MTPEQRQHLVNTGFSRKGLADAQFILDRTPKAKHDQVITLLTTPCAPSTSNVRKLTSAEIQQRHAEFFVFDDAVFDDADLSDAEIRALVDGRIRAHLSTSISTAINRITGRVD
jgi:hypothetical protein